MNVLIPIDEKATKKNAKNALEILQMLFELGVYSLPNYKLNEINENMKFEEDLVINSKNDYEDLIVRLINSFDVLPEEQKIIMYLVYVRRYSLRQLRYGENDLQFQLTSVQYQHKRALNSIVFRFQEFIVYKKMEDLLWE